MNHSIRSFCFGIWVLFTSYCAQAESIDAVYFGQTHVMKATQSYFTLVGERDTLIKVHVTDPATPASPPVSVTLTLNSNTLTLPLIGPATLPASIPDGPGVVQHSAANSFTAMVPAAWVKTGLSLTVNAGSVQTSITPSIGAPSRVIMNMTDVHFFAAASGDYPVGTFDEIKAKWPVADLQVRRSGRVIFPELVMAPTGSRSAVRVKSTTDFRAQTGFNFDGEQDTAAAWNGAIRRAAGRGGSHSLYYVNIYGVGAGGQAGGFGGVGNGTQNGILHHELGHALSLPHWGDSAAYPYKGAMHGIAAPATYNATHAGPTWAYDSRFNTFIPPTRLVNAVPTYKVDPMQGGGVGDQEAPFLLNHFSDYSVNQMRSNLQSVLVTWNPTLGSTGDYAKWNQSTGQYSSIQTNNGVQFPTVRDTQVITVMASVSGASPQINMVYPPIGPYTAGLIRLFDPAVPADRTAANSIFSPSTGSDVCMRVVQGGVQKTYMLAASLVTTANPNDAASLVTEAINLPAADGAVTRIELLNTPDVEDVGLPTTPSVFYTWSAFSTDVASFEVLPNQITASSVTMRAAAGTLDPNFTGTIEYQFTETSGNPGGTTSAWQTSRDYTDTGLSPSTSYTYRVTMRIGTGLSTDSAPATVTTEALNSTAPTVVSLTPLGTVFHAPVRPVAVFSRPIIPRTGNLTISNLTDNTDVVIPITNSQIVISGSTLTLSPTVNLLPSKNYAIRIGASAISDRQGNFFAGISDDTTWSFTTLATGATLTYRPSDGNVSINATQATGGVITSLRFENLPGTFAPVSYINPPGGGFGGTNRTTNNFLLTDTDATNVGVGGTINLGEIFPLNLTLSGLETYLSSRVYTGGVGTGQRLFALAVVGTVPTATWITDISSLWSVSSNWNPGVADGTAANFTHNITADRTVSLDSDRTMNHVVFSDSDPSTAGSWIVNNNGVTANNLILSGTTPRVTVNELGTGKSATISAVIQGSGGFTKKGPGTLNLTAQNTFSGNRVVDEGILNGGFTGAFGAAGNTATITINDGATLRFAEYNMFGEHQSTAAPTLIVNHGLITQIGPYFSSLNNITLNSGRLDSTGGLNTSYRAWALNGAITSTGASSITDSGGNSGIILKSADSGNNTNFTVQSGTLNVSGGLHDGRNTAGGAARATSITKLGPGTMILGSTGNTYTGSTNVNAGTLLIHGATSSASLVNVAAGAAMGGTGTIGHNTSIAVGGGLVFDVISAPATHDKLVLASAKSMTFVGTSTLTLTSSGAAVPGDYTLVTAPGGFGASAPPSTVILPIGWAAAAPRFVGNDLKINITTADVSDTTAPTPNPITFATLPTAQGQTSITMTAATATDPSGVEYFFDCLSPGGDDSGWQNSPVYTDSGLTPNTQYTYQVQVRDKSTAQNTGTASAPASATTDAPDITPPVILSLSPADNATDVLATSNLVATFDEVINPSSGSITIKNLSDGTQTVINVTDSTQIIISGSVLTINPSTNLLSGKNFAVQISAAAFVDNAGNPFAGISSDSAWNFTISITSGGTVVPANKITGSPTFPITGTLYALDVPYFSTIGSSGPALAGPQGPNWISDTDDGWRMLSGSNLEADHGQSPWEPDGTPIAQARTYRLNLAPGSSYTFNLPDGAIVNAVYATWLSRATSGVVWSYTEGTATSSSTVSMTAAPTADLSLNWTDAVNTTRTGNFQRIFATPITVTGDNGFTINAVRTGNTHQADAVVLSVTLPSTGAPEIALEQPVPTDIASGGSKAFSAVNLGSNASLQFTIRNTGTAALNLTGTPLVAVSGANASDFTVTAVPTTPVAASATTTFTVQFAPSAAGVRNGIITIANNDNNEGTFTINLTGTGQISYATWSSAAAFDADANGDGLANGMAWMLGAANKDANSVSKLPVANQSSGSLTLAFTCLNAAARGTATLQIQHSANLNQGDPWTSVTVPETTSTVDGIAFTVTPNGTTNQVVASIPLSEAQVGKLFARLRADMNP